MITRRQALHTVAESSGSECKERKFKLGMGFTVLNACLAFAFAVFRKQDHMLTRRQALELLRSDLSHNVK